MLHRLYSWSITCSINLTYETLNSAFKQNWKSFGTYKASDSQTFCQRKNSQQHNFPSYYLVFGIYQFTRVQQVFFIESLAKATSPLLGRGSEQIKWSHSPCSSLRRDSRLQSSCTIPIVLNLTQISHNLEINNLCIICWLFSHTTFMESFLFYTLRLMIR